MQIACYRHSHRVPVVGYAICYNRLKLSCLRTPPIYTQQELRSHGNGLCAECVCRNCVEHVWGFINLVYLRFEY